MMLDCTPTFRVLPEAVNVPSPEPPEAEPEPPPEEEPPPPAVRPVITVAARSIAIALLYPCFIFSTSLDLSIVYRKPCTKSF